MRKQPPAHLHLSQKRNCLKIRFPGSYSSGGGRVELMGTPVPAFLEALQRSLDSHHPSSSLDSAKLAL